MPKGLRDKRLDLLYDRTREERGKELEKLIQRPGDLSIADDRLIRGLPEQLGQLAKTPDNVLNVSPVGGAKNVVRVDLGGGSRLLMTVKPEAATKMQSGLKAGELPDLLKGGDVEHLHID